MFWSALCHVASEHVHTIQGKCQGSGFASFNSATLTRISPLQGMAVDQDLGITIKLHGERLVGKHVRPQVGMFVSMSGQGLERRKETGRADPSRGGVGEIMRVNENWTAGDVSLVAVAASLVGYRCMSQDLGTLRSSAFLGFQSGTRVRNLVDTF